MGRADGPPPARRTMSSHFAPRGPLPDADLRSASLIDADDVADLLGELGYPCGMEGAAERIAAIAGNDRQALVVARCEGARKSVVWGKSVSVRVDLGGRRIYIKKTTNTNQDQQHLQTH